MKPSIVSLNRKWIKLLINQIGIALIYRFVFITKYSRRQNLHSWMIFAWACRLGTFLFMRVLKDGQDKRFNEARDNPGKFFVFWSLQV